MHIWMCQVPLLITCMLATMMMRMLTDYVRSAHQKEVNHFYLYYCTHFITSRLYYTTIIWIEFVAFMYFIWKMMLIISIRMLISNLVSFNFVCVRWYTYCISRLPISLLDRRHLLWGNQLNLYASIWKRTINLCHMDRTHSVYFVAKITKILPIQYDVLAYLVSFFLLFRSYILYNSTRYASRNGRVII